MPGGRGDFRGPALQGLTTGSIQVPPNLSLVHLFRAAGQSLLWDGSSGGLVGLSAAEYRKWRDYLNNGGGAYDPPHLTAFAGQGFFRTPSYPEGALPSGVLHSICLNVSHACELACVYCFAAQGGYGDKARRVMDAGTARRAIDLALSACPPGRTLSVDFFGGEPLSAWDTVVEAVGYAREQAAERGSTVEFTLTTNAVGVTPVRAAFLAREMSTLIVSLDGRPEVHNRMRPTAGGGPSYERALAGAGMLAGEVRRTDGARSRFTGAETVDGRVDGADRVNAADDTAVTQNAAGTQSAATTAGGAGIGRRPAEAAATMPGGSGKLWVRGTFTRLNLDFWRDAEHLWDLGFDQISLEPVTGGDGTPWGLTAADLPAVRSAYRRLIRSAAERGRRFYHFELNLDRLGCANKRYLGCGAGVSYACVSPSGSVYPCHQFDGMDAFLLGSLAASPAGDAPSLPDARFARAHVGAKEDCRRCWAQLYCGGGCHHRAIAAGGGLYRPDPLACALIKIRLEAALAFAALKSGSPAAFRGLAPGRGTAGGLSRPGG